MLKKLLITLLLTSVVFATVTSTETKRQYFPCNGSTTTYTFTMECNSSDDIQVSKRLISTGDPTSLVEDTDYTITNTGDSYLEGGVVTIDPALASTYQVVIIREIVQTQETVAGAITPATVVLALDKATRLAQDARNDIDQRVLRIPDSDPSAAYLELANSVERAGYWLGFDSTTGAPFAGTPAATGISVSAFMATVNDDATAALARTTLEVTSENVMGVINPKDPPYNASGDGVTDDTIALQAAIDYAESVNGTLCVPNGTYSITSSLNVTDELRMIRGEGFWSVIQADAAMAAIFDFTSGGTDSTTNHYVTIQDIRLKGNNNANYCIYAEKLTRSNFVRVLATTAKLANIGLAGDQWINNFFECVILDGYRDGIAFSGAGNSNIFNIRDCFIEGNDRLGINISATSAATINVSGCTIEGNGEAGIWASNIRILNIHHNHFETNNTEGGITVTNPTAITIKADVVLSGAAYPVLNFVAPAKNVSLRNNYHNTSAAGDCMYYASAINIGEISSNYNTTTGKVCLGIYGHRTYSNINGLKMFNNEDADGLFADTIDILDAEPAASSYDHQQNSHDIQILDVIHKNYMPQDFTAYTKVQDAAAASTLIRMLNSFRGMNSFRISKTGATTDTWGATLDIDNDYPELSGKLCYFGGWVKWAAGSSDNALLYTTTTGLHADYAISAHTEWTFTSIVFTMPAAGATAWECGFKKLAAGASDDLDVAFPVLARVGDGYLSHIPAQNFTNEIYTDTVEISSAEILALNGTPKTLVRAAGADTIIEFISAVLIMDSTATAYAGVAAGEDLVIEYEDGDDVSKEIETTGFVDQTNDEIRLVNSVLPTADPVPVGDDLTDNKNDAIQLLLKTDEIITGTGTMTVKITYRIHTLGL